MLILIFSLFIQFAQAEYRAYELSIVNAQTGSEVKIISTLDHLQYRGFYPVGAGEEIVYVDSWMCHGNTSGHKPICPKPDERAPSGESPTPL